MAQRSACRKGSVLIPKVTTNIAKVKIKKNIIKIRKNFGPSSCESRYICVICALRECAVWGKDCNMCGYAILISFIEAVLYLTGSPDVESLDQETVEHYARMADHPVEINLCSRAELMATGLFSAYQVAVLSDYKSNTGSVLSLAELSLLDGFGESFVEALSVFISLSPCSLGGISSNDRRSHNLWGRGRTFRDRRSGGEDGSERAVDERGRGVGGEREDGGKRHGDERESDGGGEVGHGVDVSTAIVSRMSLKHTISQDQPTFSAGLRCDVDVGDRSQFWIGSSGFRKMESLTAGMNYIGKRRRTNLIIGDFNARFGQGTGVWNTMTMSSMTSVSSLLKRPSGFSVSTSFASNYALTGAAFSAEFGKHSIYAAVAMPGIKQSLFSAINKSKRKQSLSIMPILGYNFWGRHISCGLTATPTLQKNSVSLLLSADARACVSSVDIAAELTYMLTLDLGSAVTNSGSGRSDAGAANSNSVKASPEASKSISKSCEFRAVAAVSAPIGECFKAGMRAYYSPTIHSVTSSVEYSDRKRTHTAVLSAEPLYRSGKGLQTKLFASYKFSWLDESSVSVRGSFRHQTYSVPSVRGSLRIDCSLGYCGRFVTSFRTEALYCGGAAALAYIEQAFKFGSEERYRPLKIYLRTGVFFADDWNRRIYVYERDAPGCFNVPAFYGRGLWASSYLSWRFSRWGRVAFRFAYTAYPFEALQQTGRTQNAGLSSRVGVAQKNRQPQIKRKPDRLESRIQASFNF